MTDPGRTRRRLLGLARLAAVLIGAGVFAALLTQSLQNNDSYASILSGIATIVTLFIGLFDHLRRQDPVPPLDDAAEDLRIRLLDEYAPELHRRSRRSPHEKTIPLEWRKYGGSGRSPLDGRFEGDPDEAAKRLAERFDQPTGKKRMVVLGEPGAGKTFMALALAVGLLHRWKDDGLIAVYLSLSSWDPVVDTLDEWMVGTIAKSYYSGEQRTPKALLTDKRLVPVLDGLDELPEHLRRVAVQRINNSLTGDRMLVVTCRTTEYEDVLPGGAPRLLHAPAVEVRPVTQKDVLTRLREVPAWKDVLRDVETRPHGALAAALSTPLMLSLFAAGHAGRDPAELLDQTKFATRHAVENHLVDLKLNTAYPEHDQWNAKQAKKWLTFLAQHMHDNDERDVTWRKLAHQAVSTTTQLIVTFALAAGVLWLGTLYVESGALLDYSSLTYLLVGAPLAAIWLASRHRQASQAPDENNRVIGFRRGAVIGFTVVVVPGLFMMFTSVTIEGYYRALYFSATTAELLALAVVCGAAVGLHEMLVERTTAQPTGRSASDGLKQERTSTLAAAAAAGLVIAALAIPASALALSVGAHLGQRLAVSFNQPSVTDLGLPPLQAYVHWSFTPADIAGLAETGVVIGLVFALVLAGTRAWSRLLTVRVKLACTGRIPWRLGRFLSDATERGLLRRVGTAHQFGHALLQERLVSAAASTPRPRRSRLRFAAAAAVLLVAFVGGVAWSGRPAGCRDTPWPQIDERMARATIGPETACFAAVDRGGEAYLRPDATNASALAAISATPPGLNSFTGVSQRSMVVVGEFDRFSTSEWHDVLVGLAAAKQLDRSLNTIRFVFSDLERSSGQEAISIVEWYLGWAHDRGELRGTDLQAPAVILGTTTSGPVNRSRGHLVGLDDTDLHAKAKELGDLETKNWVAAPGWPATTVEALVDGVTPDECAALQSKRQFTLKVDLRGEQPTSKLLGDIASCGRASVLVKPEDVPAVAAMQRPDELTIVALYDRFDSIGRDCTRALGANPNAGSVKTCVATVAASERFRVEIEEIPIRR